jgi:hypothetical protein
LELIRNDADFGPAPVGAKVTATVQLDPAAKVGVRLAQGCGPPVATLNEALSGPVIPKGLPTTSGAMPVLLTVKIWTAGVLTVTVPKSLTAGVTVISGAVVQE